MRQFLATTGDHQRREQLRPLDHLLDLRPRSVQGPAHVSAIVHKVLERLRLGVVKVRSRPPFPWGRRQAERTGDLVSRIVDQPREQRRNYREELQRGGPPTQPRARPEVPQETQAVAPPTERACADLLWDRFLGA